MYKYMCKCNCTCKFMGKCTHKCPITGLSLICRSTPPPQMLPVMLMHRTGTQAAGQMPAAPTAAQHQDQHQFNLVVQELPHPLCPNAPQSCTKHSCGQCTGRGCRAREKNRKTKEEEKNSRNLVSWLQCWGLHLKEHHTHKKRFPTHSLTSKITVKSSPVPAILAEDPGA